MKDVNKDLEKIIKLIEEPLINFGYEIKRFRKSKKYSTTAYDCLCIKAPNGTYSELSINKLEDIKHPYSGKIERAKDKFESI